MDIENIGAKRSRAHTRYETKNGTLVPGVTTILGILAKPALYRWHNLMGLQNIDTTKYVDVLALAGTLGHDMICCHNEKREFKSDESRDIIDKAETCFLKYLDWEKQHQVEPLLGEEQLVSEFHGYGGTIDFYGKVGGLLTLIDFKTSKAIYDEHLYQVAAYRHLLEENGHRVEQVRILQIGRDESEGFSEKVLTDTGKQFAIFLHCLEIYKLQRKKTQS